MDSDNEQLWEQIKRKRGRELILLIDALIGGFLGGVIASFSYMLVERESVGLPGFWGKVLEMAFLPSLATAAAYLRQRPPPPEKSNDK